VFSEFADSDMRLLEKISSVERFGAGEAIFSEDESGDKLYIVICGRVKIFTCSGVRRKILAYLEKDEFFGEMALLDAEPRSASSVAMDECELIVIRKKDFRKLLEKYPRLAFQVMKTLSKRLRRADKQIESLIFSNVFGRIAETLLHLAGKYGQKAGAGIRLKIPVSHKEIAELTGTGREVVSRILNRFKRFNCIAYKDKRLVITDPQKLKTWIY
jgi:CRP/FNR family transcriptional regulator, cyclic AMP receptor protein